jgi:hypothetical protein
MHQAEWLFLTYIDCQSTEISTMTLFRLIDDCGLHKRVWRSYTSLAFAEIFKIQVDYNVLIKKAKYHVRKD